MGMSVPIIEADLTSLGLDGYFDPEQKAIFIHKEHKNKFIVLCHEIMHGVFHRVGIDQTSISRDLQEILAESIANFLSEEFVNVQKIKKKYDDEIKNSNSRGKEK